MFSLGLLARFLVCPMAEEKLGLVKDYITKYNLEAEVSYAVNLALQAESDDPFRVIVEYLRTLQKVRAPRPHPRPATALTSFHPPGPAAPGA